MFDKKETYCWLEKQENNFSIGLHFYCLRNRKTCDTCKTKFSYFLNQLQSRLKAIFSLLLESLLSFYCQTKTKLTCCLKRHFSLCFLGTILHRCVDNTNILERLSGDYLKLFKYQISQRGLKLSLLFFKIISEQ